MTDGTVGDLLRHQDNDGLYTDLRKNSRDLNSRTQEKKRGTNGCQDYQKIILHSVTLL